MELRDAAATLRDEHPEGKAKRISGCALASRDVAAARSLPARNGAALSAFLNVDHASQRSGVGTVKF